MKKVYKKIISDILFVLSDKSYIKIRYFLTFKKRLNLKKPKTFNEKIQWIKLYDRNPIYTKMVDKYEAKKIAECLIGSQYIIPTIGVWEKSKDINFENLPRKFVLKCTHDSASTIIVNDKSTINIEEIRKHFDFFLKRNHYKAAREWAYKDVKPRIIAEPLIEDAEVLKDYKFFCFDGVPKIVYISSNEHTAEASTDYFDIDFNHLDLVTLDKNAIITPKIPCNYEHMVELARKLSTGIPQIRIDLYNANGKIYFGEFTLYSNGGFVSLKPEKWDGILGDYIVLQNEK